MLHSQKMAKNQCFRRLTELDAVPSIVKSGGGANTDSTASSILVSCCAIAEDATVDC